MYEKVRTLAVNFTVIVLCIGNDESSAAEIDSDEIIMGAV